MVENVNGEFKIGVISDTHGYFEPKLKEFFKDCDEIWLAGDIGDHSVYNAVSEIAPIIAVYGNIDGYPLKHEVPFIQKQSRNGIQIYMTHIGGYPGKYNSGIKEILKKEKPGIFICGHSHILKVMYDKELELLHINPGAIGLSGFHTVRTAIRFRIANSKPDSLEILELDRWPNFEKS